MAKLIGEPTATSERFGTLEIAWPTRTSSTRW
jgi:hypothetical protein